MIARQLLRPYLILLGLCLASFTLALLRPSLEMSVSVPVSLASGWLMARLAWLAWHFRPGRRE